MSAYTEEVLIDKLNKLNNTQQSVQTLSHWVMFHRKRCAQSIQVWDREIFKAPKDRKLVYLYLANDIMQTSRKKGGEFIKEFSRVLPGTIAHVYRECDVEEKKGILRLLGIWEERRVYPSGYVELIRRSLRGLAGSDGHLEAAVPAELLGPSAPNKAQTEPLTLLIRELEAHEVSTALIADKLPSPSLLNGEMLKNCSNQAQISELAIEMEDAVDLLDSYHKSLENDILMRNKLVLALRDYLNVQEAHISSTKTKLQECNKQMSLIESLKMDIQGLQSGNAIHQKPNGTTKAEKTHLSSGPFSVANNNSSNKSFSNMNGQYNHNMMVPPAPQETYQNRLIFPPLPPVGWSPFN